METIQHYLYELSTAEHDAEIVIIPIIILLVCLGFGYSMNRYMRYRFLLSIREDSSDIKDIILKSLQGLPLIWSFGIAVYWIVHCLKLPHSIEDFLGHIIFTLVVFSIFHVLARAVSAIADARIEKDANNTNTLLKTVFSFFIYAMGIFIILSHFGISIAPFLTALGVGGFAIAFGLQETLANIFAGFQLLLSHQIRVGDYVRLSPSEEGCVTDITWRFTTVLTATNSVIIVPNQKIAAAILTNYSRPTQKFTVIVPVGVSYDSDLERVEEITLSVADAIMREVDGLIIAPPLVRFHTFGESSINFNVLLHTSNFNNQGLLKHKFVKALKKSYDAENIEIPYPIRTILPKQGLEVVHK